MTDIARSEILPVGGADRVSTAWWGMACLIATEAILFVYLIFSYAYLGSQQPGPWPPSGPPSLKLAIPNTIILIASSFVLGWGVLPFERRRDRRRPRSGAGRHHRARRRLHHHPGLRMGRETLRVLDQRL